MRKVILFRKSFDIESEIESASKIGFTCLNSRLDIRKDDLVIGRYSVLPFYNELENDIIRIGAQLINTYKQHNYIADLWNWYGDLKDHTPKTWQNIYDIDDDGPFILKGCTNSKKFLWNTHMFAQTKRDAINVLCKLQDDELIGMQQIYIRKYIPLKKLTEGLHGLPISEEYRFFICNDNIICGNFYWSNHIEDVNIDPNPPLSAFEFVIDIVNIIRTEACFYVIDIAKTENDDWIVIELNDGQMSGLSNNDPDIFYKNLLKVS
jgi:hypothetical protein